MVRGTKWCLFDDGWLSGGAGLFLLCIALIAGTPVLGQVAKLNELSDEEQQQIQIAERFLTVLEQNPRRGTALDRIYGHHVEFGTLDHFMTTLRDRVKNAPEDGIGWMLLGLFESHRGEDANAIDAFTQAEKFRAKDALASYYLGQAQLLLGQPEQAVAAFERAIARAPQRRDLLEVFQQLGRIHQRAHRTEEAFKTWERLEALFPDDPRVQEQIAVTLVEEGEFGLALPRYEKLTTLVRDDYRRTMFRIEAAGLKIRENRRDEGIADFETLLGDLNPESWLYRDVRRRIEDVFLRSGDQDGLSRYYEKWISAHPDDVDAMARHARFLASSARVPEATKWLEKALTLAPTRTELRKTFIDQLVDDQRYTEALQQYELLVESAPGNPDFLRDWGKLAAKNKRLEPEARKVEAKRIWSMIIAARPNDALTTAQVADLFRQSTMNDEALALYQKAITQSPNDPQYREYLGEFYHILKRPQEALATWTSIAEGERHTAINVARLAELYHSFGYVDESVPQIAEACRLDPKDFSLQLKAAEYHSRAGQFDMALAFITAAEKLAANTDEQAAIVTQRIDVFRSSRRLDDEIDSLSSAVHGNESASAEEWHLLARYCEADSRWSHAMEAVDHALARDAQSISILTTAARIAELSGDYAQAANTNRQLAEVDRRSRGDHLMNVARLEAQLGRSKEALQAGKDLIVSAPGNTDNYEFYARLCNQLGKPDEGIDALRKAVRINPTEPHLITALGAALSNQFRTDEAIEVYWRAFEKTDELDDKTSLSVRLTELYLQINQFDKLTERLERGRREEALRRDMTICLAQAHHTSGDYGTARQELESLLSEDTRDTNLLQQLSKLCAEGADSDGAIEYQRQLAAIAPGHETEYRLAILLQARGDRDEASEILMRLMQREEDPVRRLRNIDSLLTQGAYESVIAMAEPLLSEQRDAWEVLYREAAAWALLGKTEEARGRFERLLALPTAHDELGVVATDQFKKAQAKARSNNRRGIQSSMPTRPSPFSRLNQSPQIRQAVGLDPDRGYYRGGSGPQPVWTPAAYGDARMAAYGWLMRFDQENDTAEKKATADKTNAEELTSWEKQLAILEAAITDDEASRDTLCDWLYVEQLRGNLDSIFRMARRLAVEGGREEQQFFLRSLAMRGVDSTTQQVSSSSGEKPKREPLSDEDLELMLQCHESLSRDGKGARDAALVGGSIIYDSNGQAYMQVGGSWVQVPGLLRGNIHFAAVVEELKLAGREEQAAQLVRKQIESAETSQQLVAAMNLLSQDEKSDQLDATFSKWTEAAFDDVAKGPAMSSRGSGSSVTDSLTPAANLLLNWMGRLGPEEEHAKILAILDVSLDLSTEIAQRRRAERSRRRRASTGAPRTSATRFYLQYGEERVRVEIDYPSPNEHVDRSSVMLLREAYEVFQRNEVLDDLAEHLEKRLQEAPEDKKLYATLGYAYVRWWQEDREDALALLNQAGVYLKDDPAFHMEVATLHQSMGNLEDALELVDAIAPRDQDVVQQRELMALQLAERLGDIERARQSAERLFGLRLNNDTRLSLVDPMRRLGMHDMAEAIVSRVERRAGNSLSSMGTLMALYQSQGKAELAQQLAHNILRRTKPPLSIMANASVNPRRYSSPTGDAQLRTQSLRLLQQTGALKGLIARLEDRIKRSPDSPRLYEELIEFYETVNDRDKVGVLLAEAISRRPDAVGLRYQCAKNLEASGEHAEACDQYLEILRQKPQWITDDLYSVRRVFERANRSFDLIKAIENMNIKAFRQPYYVVDLVSNMMRTGSNKPTDAELALALNLFEKAFDAFPQYRNRMISQMRDENLWKNERVFALGKKAVVPTIREVAATPWFGISDIYSYSSDGRVTGQFGQMLNGLQGSEKLTELQKAIEDRLEEAPNWHGGTAMLALIDFKQNRQEPAKKRLEALISDEDLFETIPTNSCWIIGQELDQFEDTLPLALKLFESAATRPNSMNQVQYSPMARLIDLYGRTGRKTDARDILNKVVSKANQDSGDPQYSSYVYIENAIWAGQQFLKFECPVDAVRVFRRLSDDRAASELAGQWYGNQPGHFQSQIDQGLEKAIAALDNVDSNEAMTELLSVPDDLQEHGSVLDLMLLIPDINELRTTTMDSPLVELLAKVSRRQAIADNICRRFAQLRTDYPSDLSIGIAEAAYLIRMKHEHGDEALQGLLTTVMARPLEDVKPGRRPNSRQRRQALAQVPLWLVARDCLKDESQQELGTTLGLRALEAAKRQVDDQPTAAILYDWGKIALERNDRVQAEAKWSELLEIVTRRPERKKKPANQKTSSHQRRTSGPSSGVVSLVSFSEETAVKEESAPQRIPPLTISQFRLTMEIATVAAENGMAELSVRAVKVSMLGGIPVSDLASSPNGGPGMVRAPTVTRSLAGAATGLSQNETEVAESLRKVISLWQTDEYPSEDVYELLVPIVFPENRPAEILLFADSSELQDARIKSLGALLVDYADKAQRLQDLTTRLDARMQNPQTKVAALVLRSGVALAQDRLDEAKLTLTELAGITENGALTPMVQLACHAALPATEHKALEEPAYAILQTALRMQFLDASASSSGNSGAVSLGGLLRKVNRYLASDPEEVEKFFESYLAGRQAYYARYSGNSGLRRQWSDWATIADEAARAGVTSVAMDYLGRVVDFSMEDYGRPSIAAALAVVCHKMNAIPPEERYEVWRDWTLPVAGRQTVRLAADWGRPALVPKRFLDMATYHGPHSTDDPLCNFTELLTSARQCGRLEELRVPVQAAYDAKLENASFLYALLLIQLGDLEIGKQVVTPMIDSVGDRLKRQPNGPRPQSWADYLLYRDCLRSPQFAALYRPKKESLELALRALGDSKTLARLNVDLALRADGDPNLTIRPGDDPQLAHWFPATTRECITQAVAPWWVVQEGHLTHLTGASADLLYFAYPLTGEFEFTFDAYNGAWAETDVGYGGIVVEGHGSTRATLWSTGGHDRFYLGNSLRRDGDTFGTVTVRVADGKMQYIFNNHVCYEEELRGTSPWITLHTEFARPTTFRNLRFTGKPTIPREVLLVSGDRMDGWNCKFTRDSQPRHRIMARTPTSENDSIAYYQREEPTEFGWHAQDGVLLGHAQDVSNARVTAQSWVYYHRPLRDQESFSYDFFYVPGQFVAHPTVGRIALLLEPEGVQEHWITQIDWEDTVLGIAENNRLSVPQARRGPQTLPLKSGDWNRVSLTLIGQRIQVALNDELIYERPLEPEVDRLFGLYRNKTQSLKVREPKLTGPWPQSFSPEIRENLMASTRHYTVADRRAINDILTDKFIQHDTASVVAQTRQLPPEQAYEKLTAWVLPSPDHANPRLYVDIVNLDGHSQDLLCPAYEMIAVADRIGKLDELDKAISELKPNNNIGERNQMALAALVAIQMNKFDVAQPRINELIEHGKKEFPEGMALRDRCAELVVAWQAAKHPALQYIAYDIAVQLRARERSATAKNRIWGIWIDVLTGHVERVILGDSLANSASTLTQWATVPYYKPNLRAAGYSRTDWLYTPGAVQHIPGGAWGQLFFQSPLQGDFEIVAERSLHDYRETSIAYGMHAAEPRYDFKAKRITTLMHGTQDVEGEIKMPKGQWLADFRVVVNDNKVTTFVNELQLHEETLAQPPAPWLVLQTTYAGYAGTVRNLRILGTPEIPDEIDLIQTGWAACGADIYGEWFPKENGDNADNAPWRKVGDEIHGQIREDMAARDIESLMMYQRPMLEDGVIEFESYYVAGEFEVHPAIGRTALIVGQDGVRKHILTNAQYETSLASDNLAPIDGAVEQVNLKDKDWNHYRLSLRGAELTLAVNGVDVATILVTEPANERYFGLFRYGGKTKCRVRHLVYRGEWPKTLPSIEEQQLARPANMDDRKQWSEPNVISLSGSAQDLKAAGLQLQGPAERILPRDKGTQILLKQWSKHQDQPRLRHPMQIEGDFMITLDFEDLRMVPAKTGWGSTFSLRTFVGQGGKVYVESGIGMTVTGEKQFKSDRRHKTAAGIDKHVVRRTPLTFEPEWLRLARSGSSIATYVAEKSSEQFKLIEVFPVGTDPIQNISVECSASDSAAVIDAMLKRLTIQYRDTQRRTPPYRNTQRNSE